MFRLDLPLSSRLGLQLERFCFFHTEGGADGRYFSPPQKLSENNPFHLDDDLVLVD